MTHDAAHRSILQRAAPAARSTNAEAPSIIVSHPECPQRQAPARCSPDSSTARTRLAAVAALLLSVLAGCGGPAPAVRDDYFSLNPRIQVIPSPQPLPATLLVDDFAARGFAGGNQIVFRLQETPLQTQRYQDYLWEEIPGRALAEDLTAALDRASVFATVLGREARVSGDYLLSGRVLRFEHRPTDTPASVTAEIELTLVDNDTRRGLFHRRYSGERATAESTPEAMAEAFNRLSADLLGQAVRDLQAAAAALRASG